MDTEKQMTFPNRSRSPKTRFDECDMTYFAQSGHEEYYTPDNKKAQAQFENLYGYPTDIDAVWAARDAMQNT